MKGCPYQVNSADSPSFCVTDKNKGAVKKVL